MITREDLPLKCDEPECTCTAVVLGCGECQQGQFEVRYDIKEHPGLLLLVCLNCGLQEQVLVGSGERAPAPN